MTDYPPIPDEAYDAISPMVGVHLSREVLEAAHLHEGATWVQWAADHIGCHAGCEDHSDPPQPSVDDLLGVDPDWTGDKTTQEYMDRQRNR